MDALTEQVQKRYNELLKEEEALNKKAAEIRTEQKKCKAYLREAGLLEVKTRNRKKDTPPQQ